MASLDIPNPLHPTFTYVSGGGVVNGERECNCEATDTECIRQCHAEAQALLDADLEILQED